MLPAWRSGVKAVFPLHNGRGALLRIVFDDGEPAPAGAVITVEGDKQAFYVARRGEAFVTGLRPVKRAVLTWNGRQCRFVDGSMPAGQPGTCAMGRCSGTTPHMLTIACQESPHRYKSEFVTSYFLLI